jgi:indole-3-acetate monooxygenase
MCRRMDHHPCDGVSPHVVFAPDHGAGGDPQLRYDVGMSARVATASSLVDRARALAPEFAKHRTVHDQQRQLAPEVIGALRREGFVACLVPSELGGHQLTAPEYIEVLEAIAAGDSAAAWCVMTASTSALLLSYLPRATSAAMCRDQVPFLSGIFAPGGKLVSESGSDPLHLSGRWSWASGSRHADWFAVGAMQERRHVVCFVPASQVTIVENWDTLGLAGTGSHDLVIEAVQVASDHVTSLLDQSPWSDAPVLRVPVFGLLAAGISACALGVAGAALARIAATLTADTGSATLARYAHARAMVDSARAYLLAAATSAQAQAAAGTVDGRCRGELRLAASFVAQQCAEVTRTAFHLGGGASVRAGSPLGAALRDVETMLTHRMVVDRIAPAAARALLGLGAVPPDL